MRYNVRQPQPASAPRWPGAADAQERKPSPMRKLVLLCTPLLVAAAIVTALGAGLVAARPADDLAGPASAAAPERPAAPLAPAQGSTGGSPSACSVAVSETLSPENPRICDTGDVTVTMAVSCPTHLPVRLVIAIDRSKSIADPSVSDILSQIQRNVRQVLDELDFDLDPETKAAVVSHGFRVTVETELTNEKSRVIGAANGIRFLSSDLGEDPGEAIEAGMQMLEDERRPGVSPIEIILLYGDGCDETVAGCEQAARAAGSRAAGKGMHVFAVCYTESDRETCNTSYRQIVSNRDYYFEGRQASRLPAEIADLVDQGENLVLDELSLREWLGPDVSYVDGSGQPAPRVAGPRITFDFAGLGLGRGQVATATYKIQPGVEGTLPLRTEGSQVTFEDSLGRSIDPIEVPTRDLEVGPCIVETPTPSVTPTPEPTETPTITPTSEHSPTPEPTDTATTVPATATSTVTPTPETVTAYLPLVARRVCKLEARTTDVVLVIDASSSMEQQSGEQRKIDAAKQAAKSFVGLLDPNTDRAGVVAFDRGVTRVSTFGTRLDVEQLRAFIDTITTGEGTRIDLALQMAGQQLWDSGRDADNQIIVLLTDGLPDGGTEGLVLDAAGTAKDSGIMIYTIGLGTDVDPHLLRQVASRPDLYLEAPSADQLEAIYAELAGNLPCPGGVIIGQP